MSENERKSQANAAINDKLQGTVVTYLGCGGIVNNQIKKCWVYHWKKIKIDAYLVWYTDKKMDCVMHFLRLLAADVVAGRTKCTRQPPPCS